MVIIIVVFSVVYLSLALLFEINVIKKYKRLSLSSLIGFLFIFTYGIFPLLFVIEHEIAGVNIARYDYSTNGLMDTFFWQFFGMLAYLVFRYKTTRCFVIKKQYDTNLNNAALLFAALLCTVIGIVSFYLWSKAYGGIWGLIKVANSVRGGWNDVVNTFTFFKHPSRLVLISSIASLLLVKHSYKKTINKILFLISFVFSILFLLASDGRLSLALYLLMIIFIVFDVFNRQKLSGKKLFLIILLGLCAYMLIINMDEITRYIRTGVYINSGKKSIVSSIINEFSYVLISGQTSFRHASTGRFMIFDDVFHGIMAWIPSSLKPFKAVDIWNYNTSLISKSSSGQIPCDFISASLYDLSYLGPIVFGVFWGSIINQIEKLQEGKTIFHMVCYYSLCLTFLRLVNYCMLYSFILSIFALAIFVVVFFFIKNILYKLNNK